MRRAALAAGALLCATAAYAADPDTVRVARMRYLMGTLVTITAFAPDSARAGRAIDAAFEEMQRLDSLLTDWRGGGDIARVNAAAGSGEWVPVSADTWCVLDDALRWSVRSRGAFDPTIRPLVAAWGFRDSSGAWRAPTRAEIARARALVGARGVLRDSAARAVRLARPGMALDLGAIGKGYALDRAGERLESLGVHRALLDAGGQLLALDAPPDAPAWPVVVPDPRDAAGEHTLATLALERASVATSNQSERVVGRGAHRTGHILDPRTGRAARASRTASAVAPRAVDADALSTAAFVSGARHAVRLARTCAGAGVLLVDAAGRVHRSRFYSVRIPPEAPEIRPRRAR